MTSEKAFGLLSGVIKSRKDRKLELKYKEILYLDDASYHNTVIDDDETVRFQFTLNCQEINCLVDSKTGEVKEGNPTLVESCYYVIELKLNPEPIVDILGHPWTITIVERTGVVQQLI